jgi:SGT1 protein
MLRSGKLILVHSSYLKNFLLSCSVRDSDGEFLLIEAADSLPSWVTPSVVENRVRTSSSS